MNYFTKQQIEEIRRRLASIGVKDSDLPDAETLTGDELVAIVQNGENRKASIYELLHDYLPEDFVDGLHDGKSAYEIWLDQGNTGTEADFLASLKGMTGAIGPRGPIGPPGMPGSPGITEVKASVDANTGTPSVRANINDGTLTLSFHNLKGEPGSGGGMTEVPVATPYVVGGMKLGYTQNEKNYPVKLDNSSRAFVTVPWTSDGGASGSDGGHWDQAFCVTLTDAAPTQMPLDAYPFQEGNGWSQSADTSNGRTYVWMSTRWVSGNGTPNAWQGPWQIGAPGGLNGVDGDKFEYIYATTATDSSDDMSSLPAVNVRQNSGGHLFSEDDFVPDGWTDNPVGVSQNMKAEWMCFRVKTFTRDDATNTVTGHWDNFIGPVLWSSYGKNGLDGDGVEYIFYASTANSVPAGQRPDEWPANQTDEYTGPSGSAWKDNPIDLATLGQGAKEWVSIRKKKTVDGVQQWGKFSEPALWTYIGKDGVVSGYIVDLSNENMLVSVDSNGTASGYSNSTLVQVFNNGAAVPVDDGSNNGFTVTVGTITRSDRVAVTSSQASATVASDGKTVNVTITSLANFSGINLFVPLTVHMPDGTSRDITVSAFGVRLGEDGMKIDLVTGAAAIRSDYYGNNVVPGAITVQANIFKGTSINEVVKPTDNDSRFQFKYYWNVNNGTPVVYTLTTANSIAATTGGGTYTGLTVELYYYYNNQYILIDNETLPFVKDGAPGIGIDAINYWISPVSNSISATKSSTSGAYSYSGSVSFRAYKQNGNNSPVEFTTLSMADGETISVNIGSDAVTPTYDSAKGCWIATRSGATTTSPYTVVRITSVTNTTLASITIPFSISGETGKSVFTSTVFKRSATKPSTPGNGTDPSSTTYGGTYYDPVPYGWEDGVPPLYTVAYDEIMQNQLWSSHRVFTSDGLSPQESSWSEPVLAMDTSTLDIEFAPAQADDAIPPVPTAENRHGGSGTQVWYDPVHDANVFNDASSDYIEMVWRAECEVINGTHVGNWVITRVKGERGPAGTVQGLDAVIMRFSNYDTTGQTTYYAGSTPDAQGFTYLDVVLYEVNGNKFYYRPTTDMIPGESNYVVPANAVGTANTGWSLFTAEGDAAFQALIAKYGFIENLTGREIVITNRVNNTDHPVAGITSGTAVAGDGDKLGNITRGNVRIWAGDLVAKNATSLLQAPFYVTDEGFMHAEGDIDARYIRFYQTINGQKVLRIQMGMGVGDSSPVLKFYDEDGTTVLYDLGPEGIKWVTDGGTYSDCQFGERITLSRIGTAGQTISAIWEKEVRGGDKDYYPFYMATKVLGGATTYYNYDEKQGDGVANHGWQSESTIVVQPDFTVGDYQGMLVPTNYPYSLRPNGCDSQLDVWPAIPGELLSSAPVDGWYIVDTEGFDVASSWSDD